MNAEPFALDSNILVYTVDRSAREKQRRAREIVRLAASRPCVLALQSIGEFFVAATRKTYVSRKEAARRARD
jgi:predicted nucleic acid-binding protein